MKKGFGFFAAVVMITACGWTSGSKNNGKDVVNEEGVDTKVESVAEAAKAADNTGDEKKVGTSEGMKFVDFTIPDSDGKQVKFSDYVGKGKYVLVDFWASWCGPCRRMIPYIREVYDLYHGENFDVLGVAVWDKPEDTKAAAVEHGVIWNQIINAGRIPTDIYGIDGIPHIMLIAPDGTILNRGLYGDDIKKAVEKALGIK